MYTSWRHIRRYVILNVLLIQLYNIYRIYITESWLENTTITQTNSNPVCELTYSIYCRLVIHNMHVIALISNYCMVKKHNFLLMSIHASLSSFLRRYITFIFSKLYFSSIYIFHLHFVLNNLGYLISF